MAFRPIETRYAGCRFRSRLEARWAVFFDSLGVTWEYEPQGFHVGPEGRPYLPDFRLDRAGGLRPLWVEVKGTDDALDTELLGHAVSPEWGIGEETARGKSFPASGGGGSVILLLGPVPDPHPTPMHSVIRSIFGHPCMHRAIVTPDMGLKQIAYETELAPPDVIGPMVGAATKSAAWSCPDHLLHPEIEAAYQAARSARFEHWEAGR